MSTNETPELAHFTRLSTVRGSPILVVVKKGGDRVRALSPATKQRNIEVRATASWSRWWVLVVLAGTASGFVGGCGGKTSQSPTDASSDRLDGPKGVNDRGDPENSGRGGLSWT